MKQFARKCLPLLPLLFVFIGTVKATDESFAHQFLGSPLLVLVVLLAIGGIAFLYHKIRK